MRWAVTVYASDYAASKEFYRDTLGMDVEETGPDSLVARRDGLEIRVDGGARKRKRGRAWMQEAGFRESYVEPLVGPDSMVVGIK